MADRQPCAALQRPGEGRPRSVRRPRGDAGSITPMILAFFLIALLLVAGAGAGGGAFLAQRDLQSDCDAAALAAANALAASPVYGGDAQLEDGLPLTSSTIDDAIGRVRGGSADATDAARGMTMSGTTDGHSVRVACARVAEIPFGALFGYADGLPRSAASKAVAPGRTT